MYDEKTHSGILGKTNRLDEIAGDASGTQNTPSNDARVVVVADDDVVTAIIAMALYCCCCCCGRKWSNGGSGDGGVVEGKMTYNISRERHEARYQCSLMRRG